jgi:hypothetical protein
LFGVSNTIEISIAGTYLRQRNVFSNSKLSNFVNDPENTTTPLVVELAARCKFYFSSRRHTVYEEMGPKSECFVSSYEFDSKKL